MGHLAEKFNTTYNSNPQNILNKIAFSFSNIMTINISGKFVFVVDESRGFFYQFCTHQLTIKGKGSRFWPLENNVEIGALKLNYLLNYLSVCINVLINITKSVSSSTFHKKLWIFKTLTYILIDYFCPCFTYIQLLSQFAITFKKPYKFPFGR